MDIPPHLDIFQKSLKVGTPKALEALSQIQTYRILYIYYNAIKYKFDY